MGGNNYQSLMLAKSRKISSGESTSLGIAGVRFSAELLYASMKEACFNCLEPASERFTLVFEDGSVLDEQHICPECVSAFREEDWMEVHNASALTRGESSDEDDTL